MSLRSRRVALPEQSPRDAAARVLATAGGLVFSGAGRGVFAAFGSGSGHRLWAWQCEAVVNAPPVTYRAGGHQVIAVAVGGNALFGFKQGDAVMAFALPGETH